jgi:type I restriction enzyme S subunit
MDKLLAGVEVEWKPLGEVADVTKLAGYEFTEHIKYSDHGSIIALRGLNIKNGDLNLTSVKYIDGSNFKKLSRSKLYINDMLFTYVGTIGEVALIDVDDKYYLAPNVARIRFTSDFIIPKFMRFYFQSNLFVDTQINRYLSCSSMKNLTMENIRKFLVPIPPLAIQAEIVRMLDTFTKLTAELTAELTARKKQYNYYRDKLLNFEDGQVEWKPLGEIIKSLKTGLNPRQNFELNTIDATSFYLTVREIQNGNIVFLEKTDRVNNRALELINNRSNLEVGDILFSGTGTVGRTAVVKTKPINWNIKEGVYVIKPDQTIVISRYLSHILNAQYMVKEYSKKIVGSPVVSLPMSELKKLLIPIPPIEIQTKIVAILDKFDALTNSITEGLPREIELRQRQYEYYRELLLSFPKVKVTA